MYASRCLGWVLLTGVVIAGPAAGEQQDWPTVQGDNARTGWSKAGPGGQYQRRWWWVHEKTFTGDDMTALPERSVARLNRLVQPVVADGRVMFGSTNGRLYCLSLDTGQELWRYATEGPITHTAAVAAGRCVVTSGDGRIHAVEAATGRRLWTFQTGAALMVAPLIEDGTVYAGSRDGTFYAIDARSGELRWSHKTAAPILCTAATDGRRVYFGNEAGTLFALTADTGRVAWTHQTPLGSTRHYWPVVTGGKVIFRVASIGPNAEHSKVRDLVARHNGEPWPKVEPLVVDLLTEHPEEETFLVLDARTGRKPRVFPVGLLSRHGDVPPPPIVHPAGEVYAWLLTTNSSMRRSGFGAPTSHDIGRVDLDTGQVRSPMPPGSRAVHLRNCTDDYNFLTGAGAYIAGHHTRPTMLMPIEKTDRRRSITLVGQWGPSFPWMDDLTLPDRRTVVRYGGDHNLGRGYSGLVVLDDTILVNLFGRRMGILCWEETN